MEKKYITVFPFKRIIKWAPLWTPCCTKVFLMNDSYRFIVAHGFSNDVNIDLVDDVFFFLKIAPIKVLFEYHIQCLFIISHSIEPHMSMEPDKGSLQGSQI